MSLKFTVPDSTVFLLLPLDHLDEYNVTFHGNGKTLTFERKLWERVGRPFTVEIPLVERLKGGAE